MARPRSRLNCRRHATHAEGVDPLIPSVSEAWRRTNAPRAMQVELVDRNRTPLLLPCDVPYSQLRTRLRAFASALATDMLASSSARTEAAEGWAQQTRAAFTAVLDQQLRDHRPRAGRIEEVMRREVSAGLLARKRRVERFVAQRVAAAEAQVQAFERRKAALGAALERGVASVSRYSQLLLQCQSCSAVDVRQRDLERLAQSLQQDGGARFDACVSEVHSGCGELAEELDRFVAVYSLCNRSSLNCFQQRGGARVRRALHVRARGWFAGSSGKCSRRTQKGASFQLRRLQSTVSASTS